MKKIFSVFVSGCLLFSTAVSVQANETYPSGYVWDKALEGRWDITIDIDGTPAPSWLEITHSGNRTFVGRFVAVTGSARPVSKVNVTGNKFSFSIPPQWEEGDADMVLEGELNGADLAGTIVTSEGKKYNWTGKRAPSLLKSGTPAWGKPVTLFNGKDLSGWKPVGDKENQWVAENGILKSPKSGVNLVTEQKFTDFKLHIEFRYQKGSNSGIYLRGRHEVQIQDDRGNEPSNILFGGIYGFVTPSEMAARGAGEWQTYDITLIGRKVSIVANGKTIVCDQLIPGITGGALDSNEGEPGPIYLQGDHGPIEFRNIVLTPAK